MVNLKSVTICVESFDKEKRNIPKIMKKFININYYNKIMRILQKN